LKGSAVAGVASAAVAAPAIAQRFPELKWRMATSWGKNLEHIWGGSELFCKLIGELTDNRWQIRPFTAGEIVPAFQVLDAVQNGTVEIGHSFGNFYFGKEPAFAFDTGIPFGHNVRGHLAWIREGGGLALIRETYARFNVVYYTLGSTGAQMGGWYRKEINGLDDLKGLKFRTSGFPGRILAKLGVVAQTIPPGDIYPALERGTIDAVELVGPADDEKTGLHKVAKYYYYPGWWEGGPTQALYVNDKLHESLSPAYKTLLETVTGYVTQWMIARYDATNPPALRRLVANGAVLKAFSRPILDACYDAAMKTYDEISVESPAFKKSYESWKQFAPDVHTWFRIGESSFENYVYPKSARS
jgi:TRAP-type mannitol/chloroaromatic compound transport system substrate-binding protein